MTFKAENGIATNTAPGNYVRNNANHFITFLQHGKT